MMPDRKYPSDITDFRIGSKQRYISIKEIAQTLGMDKSHARKFVIKCGFEFAKQRTIDSGNQLTLVLPEDKAKLLYQKRKDLGRVLN